MLSTVARYDEMKLDPGWLSKEGVIQLQQGTGASLERTMLELIDVARRYANTELSGFSVGAVALGNSGAVYFGANQEFAKAGLGQTIHAEQAAVINAYGQGERGITQLAVSAEPCGYCRQFLYELVDAAKLEILFAGDFETHKALLKELLPDAFGPTNLGVEDPLFSIQNHRFNSGLEDDELSSRALEAARRSYAPYTHAYAGVAIRTVKGSIFSGSYLENAAFNPSISPLRAGLVAVAMAGEEFRSISDVVLVEREGSSINHTRENQPLLESLGHARFVCLRIPSNSD